MISIRLSLISSICLSVRSKPDRCPTGAVSWNAEAKRLEIDNSKCIGCGQCMKACPLVAIKVFKTRAEYDKLKAEIDADPHRAEDLLIDRYGVSTLPALVFFKDGAEIGKIEGFFSTTNPNAPF